MCDWGGYSEEDGGLCYNPGNDDGWCGWMTAQEADDYCQEMCDETNGCEYSDDCNNVPCPDEPPEDTTPTPTPSPTPTPNTPPPPGGACTISISPSLGAIGDTFWLTWSGNCDEPYNNDEYPTYRLFIVGAPTEQCPLTRIKQEIYVPYPPPDRFSIVIDGMWDECIGTGSCVGPGCMIGSYNAYLRSTDILDETRYSNIATFTVTSTLPPATADCCLVEGEEAICDAINDGTCEPTNAGEITCPDHCPALQTVICDGQEFAVCKPSWGYFHKPTCDFYTGDGNYITGIRTAIGCIPVENTQELTKFLLSVGLGISGGIALLLIVYAGFLIMTSQGNPQRLQAGKELLTAALSGLLLVVFSATLLRLIGVNILRIPGFGQ